jgi:hypothetical protein
LLNLGTNAAAIETYEDVLRIIVVRHGTRLNSEIHYYSGTRLSRLSLPVTEIREASELAVAAA